MVSRLQPKHKPGFPKGKSGNPAGPKPGTKPRRVLFREKIAKDRLSGRFTPAELEALTPLDFVLDILRHPKEYNKVDRMWAADKALPYVHKKMPIAIEGGDEDKPIRVATSKLGDLSDAEIEALAASLKKIGVAVQAEDEG